MAEARKPVLFIGDVHGCYDELQLLLSKVEPDTELVFVGDLVGKGPKSVDVVRFVRSLGTRARCIRGNHEQFILDCREKEANGGVVEYRDHTHKEAIDTLSDDDWEYIAALPFYIELPEFNVVVVHAGFVPGIPFSEQTPQNMMFMRNLREDNTPSKEQGDGHPWASVWPGPQHIIFGHDAVRGLQQEKFATGLDTGCCYGKKLTGILYPPRQLITVDALCVHSEPTLPLK